MDLKIGQTVEAKLDQGRTTHRGIVRYIGEVAATGQEGDYIGLELPGPSGKNDGSPAPKAAARPAAPKAAAPKTATTTSKPRPSSVGISRGTSQSSRLSTVGTTKSTAASSRLSTAGKASQPATATPPARPSSATRPPSVTTTRPPSTTTRPTSTASRASALSPVKPKRLSVAGSAQSAASSVRTTRKPSLSSANSLETRSAAPTTTNASSSRAPAPGTRQIPEVEYRRLQKIQADTSALEEEAQQLRTENDKVKSILNKLQAKCQQYHNDVSGLKDDITRLKHENEEQAKAIQERDTMVELATIDREMAEEQKEQLEAELENERAVNEELRLELEINQEEASFITDDMPEDQKQAAMLRQAQGERDRYRDGIIRLRDMTREQIKERDARIHELEAQVAHTEDIEAELAKATANVVKLEAWVEDLREQVDASNEWEDMNVELIEKNQTLEESISRLELERRELSTIVEVSNETINDYAEHADELQAELGARDSQLAEVTRERDETQEDNAELRVLLSKHREVSMELQSRLRELEADKAMTEEEVKDVTGRFNEVMDLHRRLRNADLNDTVRHIDSSLRQLAAEEAQEELDMIKYYLTESSYNDFHSTSIKAYFRSKAISFKAGLAGSLLKTTTTDKFGTTQGPEQLLDVLLSQDIVGHLTYIHTYAEQFWTTIASCTLDDFVNAGGLFQEFESVLRTVEGCMNSLKQDTLNLKESADSTRGSYMVMGAIYRTNGYLFNARPDSALILQASIIRASLDRIRSIFDAVKTFISRIELVDEEENGRPAFDALLEPGKMAAEVLSVVTKFSNVLTALQKDGLYPALPDGVDGLIEYSNSLGQFANRAQEAAERFFRAVLGKFAKEPEGFDASFMSAQVQSFKVDLPDSLEESLNESKIRIGQWHDHASVLMNCVEVQLPPAPWIVKAQQIEANKKQAIDADKKLQLMTTELQSALLQMREREETIDTKELEIEHLKARNQEATVKANAIESLQAELSKARAERDAYLRQTETQEAEISRLSETLKHPGVDESTAYMPPTPQPHVERPEDAQARINASRTFATFVNALKDENHWLRQRENSDVFGSNLEAVFAKLRTEQAAHVRADSRHKQARAAEMLEMTFTTRLLGVAEPLETLQRSTYDDDFAGNNSMPDWKSGSYPTRKSAARVASSHRASPFTLAPIQTTQLDTLGSFAHFEDLSFVDLSPVAEDFSFEMTEAPEGFGEVSIDASN
ncbi:hypothetical protein N0V90_005941 [Kalmusia sp. IMI 367209]|nr:hypothetical protein N0V90_005941 [Kalmusia sp. IMI 367209]